MHSTTEDGEQSRVRPVLREAEGVTIPRSDVHYVVTEYGTAFLFGKSIRERALALIEIAHPAFREWLLDEAKRLGYVRPTQKLKSKTAYPAHEEQEVTLKGGKQVLIRPSRASDVEGLQEIFYHMTQQDVYTRFFSWLKALSVSEAEHLCNVDYEMEMAFVAVTGKREEESIVGSSCYYVNQTTNMAEVAYMVLPKWQACGLGGAMQRRMIEYAKKKGLRGFTAEILTQNLKMQNLFLSGSSAVTIDRDVYSCEMTMLFQE
jgi:RimJ/RimL family protein N-acetyltransferase